MAGITLAQAETQLAKYLAAEEAVLLGQSVRLNTGTIDKQVTRADLQFIQQGVALWDARVKRLAATSGGGITVRRIGCLD